MAKKLQLMGSFGTGGDTSGGATDEQIAEVVRENAVVTESPVDANSATWDDFKNFMGFNPETIPLPQDVNGELRAGMLTATGKGRWSSANGQAKPANGGELADSTFIDGGHVFEGWDASHTYRLTELIGKWAQGRAHIFSFKPNSSGTEEFGIVTVGSDHQYRGMDFAPRYAYMWGTIMAHNGFTGPNNYGSQKYYGGILNSNKETPAGAYMEVTAEKNSKAPNRVQFVDCENGMKIPVLDADPAVLEDGVMWYSTTDKVFKMVIDGAVQVLSPINVPSTLPNPNTLTFTGAVEATYDGSEAVSVEIPQGGGWGEWKLLRECTIGTNNADRVSVNFQSFEETEFILVADFPKTDGLSGKLTIKASGTSIAAATAISAHRHQGAAILMKNTADGNIYGTMSVNNGYTTSVSSVYPSYRELVGYSGLVVEMYPYEQSEATGTIKIYGR